MQLGFRYLETDVHVTTDGVAVAFHDDDLQRTCGRPGRLRDLTWAEVATARVEGREPVPRLDELIAAWPHTRWNIDCKSDHAVEALVEVIRRLDALDRVCIGSFSDSRLRTLRKQLGPGLCSSLGPVATARLVVASRTHAVMARPGGLAAQIPLRQGPVPVVTPALVRTAHRLGLQVHVWTVDDPGEMHRLLDAGVDGIMTDRPAVLREVLEIRGQWH